MKPRSVYLFNKRNIKDSLFLKFHERSDQHDFKSGDPLLSYSKMMRAKRQALEMAKVSDVLLETTKILMSGYATYLNHHFINSVLNSP